MAEEEFDNEQQDEPDFMKQLRADARKAKTLEAELNQYKQKDTLREAGLELNQKQIKALMAAHDGESNPEAFKATATELGFYTPPPAVPPEEVAAQQLVANASVGAVPVANQSLDDRIAQAKTPAELTALLISEGVPVESY